MPKKKPLDLDAVWAAVESYFGSDAPRIEHARQVHRYACEILETHSADRQVVEAAAMLHDIGIPEAERKHGSAAGPWQELEGPPIAREILERLGAAPGLIDQVAAIIAAHHSPGEVNTPEFDVIWDADWLVNLPAQSPQADAAERARQIARIFRTARGRVLAKVL
jgi:HD superfamily phosphodiesterase